MKKLLLKQLMTKRLVLLVLSFILLMPSTAWGEEYTYDSFGIGPEMQACILV